MEYNSIPANYHDLRRSVYKPDKDGDARDLASKDKYMAPYLLALDKAKLHILGYVLKFNSIFSHDRWAIRAGGKLPYAQKGVTR